jgi:CHAD domain-containing protein
MDVREIEWQFDALDLRPVLRWLDDPAGRLGSNGIAIEPVGSVTQLDVYFDTEDRRFHRAGYTLRIRRVGRHRDGEATLKALGGQREAGLRSRREVSERLEAADAAALSAADGEVGARVRAVAGPRPLRPVFQVRTRRRTWTVETEGAPPGEIALDETAVQPPEGGSPARLRRVEIEVPEPAVETVGPFVEALRVACALQPATLSKYEVGLLSADAGPARAEDVGSTEVDAEASIRAVALAVLRRQLAIMLAREPGTRLGDDIEELHQMRVAIRRLRAGLSLFEDVLPETVLAARDELRWIGQALGAVRDLDVQLEQLSEWIHSAPEDDRAPLWRLHALLEDKRVVAREAMLEALDSRRYDSFVRRFARTLRAQHRARSGPPAAPALAVAPDLIEKRFKKVRRRANAIREDSPAADYHELRIQGKRLRYTLEFLGELYDGAAKPLVKRLAAMQDVLGLHQDADVAIAWLRATAAEHRELPAETVFAMGEIAERYQRGMIDLRAAFPDTWKKVDGKPWKAFHAEIEEQRPEPPPAAPEPA